MKFDKQGAVETAMNEIWRNGYEATSVKSLSETLGITRASFYNAFGSREDMFKRAFERYGSEGPLTILHQLAQDDPLKPALTHMFREICEVRTGDPEHRGCLAVNSLAELGPHHPELAKFVTGLFEMDRAHMQELVSWAIDRGELPPQTDAAQIALLISTLVLGVNMQSKLVHEAGTLWASVRAALQGLDLYSDEGEPS